MSTASGNSVGSIFQNTSRVHPLLITSTMFIPVQVFFFFLAALGLGCCKGSSLVVESKGSSLVAVCGLLTAVVSLGVKHGL